MGNYGNIVLSGRTERKKNMEKELKTRIENERKEERKLWAAINENYEKGRERRLMEEQVEKIKKEKEQKKAAIIDFALVVVVFIVLLALMITMLVWLGKDNEEFMKECTSSGSSETWCMKQII